MPAVSVIDCGGACAQSGSLHMCDYYAEKVKAASKAALASASSDTVDGGGASVRSQSSTVQPPAAISALPSSFSSADFDKMMQARCDEMTQRFAQTMQEQLTKMQSSFQSQMTQIQQQLVQKDEVIRKKDELLAASGQLGSGVKLSSADGVVSAPQDSSVVVSQPSSTLLGQTSGVASGFSAVGDSACPPLLFTPSAQPMPDGQLQPSSLSHSAPVFRPAVRDARLPSLPLFSGNEDGEMQFTVWERDFVEEMLSSGRDDLDLVRLLRRCLTGKALAAYLEYWSTNPSISYDTMVEKFRRRFDQVKTPAEYQKECDKLKWDRCESIEDFGDRCFAACKKAKRSVAPALREDAVRWETHNVFIRTMPSNIRQMLRGCIRNEPDPDAAVEFPRLVKWVRRYLDDWEADFALDRDIRAKNEAWQTPSSAKNRGFSSTKKSVVVQSSPSVGEGSVSGKQTAAGSSSAPSQSASSSATSVVCHHCGEQGHIRPRCPQWKASKDSRQVVMAVSDSTGKVGRKRRKKRSSNVKSVDQSPVVTLKSDVEMKLDAAPLKEHLSKSENLSFSAETMMFLPIKIAGIEVDAQVDTGSPVVIVNSDVIAVLSDKYGRTAVNEMVRPVPRPFYDLQNNVLPLSGMIDIEFDLNGALISCPAMINVKGAQPVLLGLSFFERVGLEMTVPVKDGAVRWVLSPDRKVNGRDISIFFGRHRHKAQSRGIRRRQQLSDRRSQRYLVKVVEQTQQRFPSLSSGAVLIQPAVVEGKTATFVRMCSVDTACHSQSVLVSEVGLERNEFYCLPDQLVAVNSSGFFWAEVQNHSYSDVALSPGELVATVSQDVCVDVDVTDVDASLVTNCSRCRRVDPNSEVAVVLSAPEKPNLFNLRYDSLAERLAMIREKANIAGDNSDISDAQRATVIELLEKNHDVIALNDFELGECTLRHLAHKIDTGDHSPIAQPCRRVPFGVREGVGKTIGMMKETGIIRDSSSPWSSPIVPVKKPDGSIRITVDYRRLNDITKKDKYPLARCDDLVDSIGAGNPEYFTTLDLVQGYHQQKMDEASIEKTAFTCPAGHFEYTRLPMGLTNSPANFQRLQSELLRATDAEKVKVYLDDVAVVTNTFDEHIEHLQLVFDRFRSAGLRVKLGKCQFLRKEVVFLGFLVDKSGIRPNPKRVQGIQEIQPPTSVKEVRHFIGCCSYYRRFVPNFARIARPLTNLLQKDIGWTWRNEQQGAFQLLKDALMSPPVLHYPRISQPFFIVCDASAQGLGAILHQKDEKGKYCPIAYASRTTHRTEMNYSATDLEGLCLTWSLLYFHHYIWGHEVIVEVDHQPLLCLNGKHKLTARLERWNTIISSYNAVIKYRRGVDNGPADMLSRYQKVAGTAATPAVEESSVVGLATDLPPVADVVLPTEIANQRELQLLDSLFGPLIRFFEKGQLSDVDRLKSEKMSKYYRMIEGVLYFIGRDNDVPPRICVPSAEREQLIMSYHGLKNSGAHLSFDKTYQKLALKFFWPSMKSDVCRFCKRCLVCARERGVERRRCTPLKPISVDSEPFVQIGIDVMKLPKTQKGNECVLGVVDYFSGYFIFCAMPDEKAETVARALVDKVFNLFGAPKHIVSDQGVNFTSVLLKELEAIFEIKHRFTTSYMPRSNGKVERANRTMKGILTRMTMQYPEDWDDLLSHALFAYNTTPQSSTGYAPHYLVFGRHPQTVNESIFDRKTLGHKLDLVDYVSEFERRMAYTYSVVKDELEKSQSQQKTQYDKKARPSSFVVGDSVMLFRPDLKKTKLRPNFDGPFEIVWCTASNAGVRRKGDEVVEVHNIDKLSKCPSDMTEGVVVPKRKLRRHYRNREVADNSKGGGRYHLRSNANVSSICLVSSRKMANPGRIVTTGDGHLMKPTPELTPLEVSQSNGHNQSGCVAVGVVSSLGDDGSIDLSLGDPSAEDRALRREMGEVLSSCDSVEIVSEKTVEALSAPVGQAIKMCGSVGLSVRLRAGGSVTPPLAHSSPIRRVVVASPSPEMSTVSAVQSPLTQLRPVKVRAKSPWVAGAPPRPLQPTVSMPMSAVWERPPAGVLPVAGSSGCPPESVDPSNSSVSSVWVDPAMRQLAAASRPVRRVGRSWGTDIDFRQLSQSWR